MRKNLGPSVNLDFLDGYLFRLLQEIAARDGLEQSGFLNYYGYRIANKIGRLIEYEECLARYLLAESSDRRVVHAGMGLGTLACALACNGMTVTGIEAHANRVKSARLLRSALIEIWPEVADRYHIVEGFYPQVLTGKRASRLLPWRWIIPPTPSPDPNAIPGLYQRCHDLERRGDGLDHRQHAGIFRGVPRPEALRHDEGRGRRTRRAV